MTDRATVAIERADSYDADVISTAVAGSGVWIVMSHCAMWRPPPKAPAML